MFKLLEAPVPYRTSRHNDDTRTPIASFESESIPGLMCHLVETEGAIECVRGDRSALRRNDGFIKYAPIVNWPTEVVRAAASLFADVGHEATFYDDSAIPPEELDPRDTTVEELKGRATELGLELPKSATSKARMQIAISEFIYRGE